MKVTKRLIVLLVLAVCLWYVQHPTQSLASTTSCEECLIKENECINNCKNAPVISFCEELCTDNFQICSAGCS